MAKSGSAVKNVKKGTWTEEEDNKLTAYVLRYGHWNWQLLPKFAGLERCGKSCRLRWLNYLKPGVKQGKYSKQEEDLIVKLHQELGNRWSAIAEKLPGRTDNGIKNHWHAHLRKDSSKLRLNTRIKSCQSKPEKSSEVVINILESSLSSSASGDVHGDSSDSSTEDQNCPEICFNVSDGNIDDSSSFSHANSLYGFHDDFWTQPFMVETSDYNTMSLLYEEGWGLSPFDDISAINMF